MRYYIVDYVLNTDRNILLLEASWEPEAEKKIHDFRQQIPNNISFGTLHEITRSLYDTLKSDRRQTR